MIADGKSGALLVQSDSCSYLGGSAAPGVRRRIMMRKRPNILREPPSDYGGDIIVLYSDPDGAIKLDVRLVRETLWLSQKQMALLFDTERSVITKHLRNIFKSQELKKDSVCAIFAQTAADGKTYQVEHFNLDFLRLLPTREESELSWTVDMDERKRVSAEEAGPLKEKSTAKGRQAAQWLQRVADLKKAKPRDDRAIEEAEGKVKELTRESRELASKAKEIEDVVYDLKAVNPHRKPNVDDRTPEMLMDIIEAKGREIDEALAVLRGNR
jgi:hypothetical protein